MSRHEQILSVGSAVLRADFWRKNNNTAAMKDAILEALGILDILMTDEKWQEADYMISGLKSELEHQNSSDSHDGLEKIYNAL